MGSVWVFERRRAWEDMLSFQLLFDFAVRLVTRQESLFDLLAEERGALPAVLIVDTDLLDEKVITSYAKTQKAKQVASWVFLSEHYGGENTRPEDLTTQPEEVIVRLAKETSFVVLKELVSKLIGLQACKEKNPARRLSYRNLVFDSDLLEFQMLPDGPAQSLSLKEARLLKLFIQRPDECLSREIIKEAVWGEVRVSPRTIDSQISRLRKRLEFTGVQIENVYGGGYIFQ